MTTLDFIVLGLYFVGITAFGAMFGRFTKTTKDFFMAGQRFPAWLIAFSCVATLVGSYSFVKYSAAGFTYGIASSQTYLNDWFWMPLWMFGWLPILYFGGIVTVPSYFTKRFGPRVRVRRIHHEPEGADRGLRVGRKGDPRHQASELELGQRQGDQEAEHGQGRQDEVFPGKGKHGVRFHVRKIDFRVFQHPVDHVHGQLFVRHCKEAVVRDDDQRVDD